MIPDDLSTIEVTDLVGVQSAILELKDKYLDLTPLWRGHADLGWKLQPEVFRTAPSGKPYQERTLMGYFMAQAESRYQRCPGFSDNAAWLVLARHYGLPTRLMDWSWSPLVALYFASQNDNKEGCLWALEPGL